METSKHPHIITVTVKAGSRKGPLITKNHDTGMLTIYVREPAVDGKANKAVIGLLSDYLDIPTACIVIRNGQSSRVKRIELAV
mgnify:CR=1 FL=1